MIETGAKTILRITADRPPVSELGAAVRSPDCGAVVCFEGIVREDGHGKRRVVALTYEIYEAPALRECAAIAEEARARFGQCNIAIVQRTGRLGVGETSIAIAVAAPHRAAAFGACEYAIDELKKRVPIWKKEEYADGSSSWVENHELPA
jgi:molybdopterin synthase catalytic subunit